MRHFCVPSPQKRGFPFLMGSKTKLPACPTPDPTTFNSLQPESAG